jgi:hypothetical protein
MFSSKRTLRITAMQTYLSSQRGTFGSSEGRWDLLRCLHEFYCLLVRPMRAREILPHDRPYRPG